MKLLLLLTHIKIQLFYSIDNINLGIENVLFHALRTQFRKQFSREL